MHSKYFVSNSVRVLILIQFWIEIACLHWAVLTHCTLTMSAGIPRLSFFLMKWVIPNYPRPYINKNLIMPLSRSLSLIGKISLLVTLTFIKAQNYFSSIFRSLPKWLQSLSSSGLPQLPIPTCLEGNCARFNILKTTPDVIIF